jgi:hypothetical protein
MDKKQILAARKAALDAKAAPKPTIIHVKAGLFWRGVDLETLPFFQEIRSDDYVVLDHHSSEIHRWCLANDLLIAVDSVNKKQRILAEARRRWSLGQITANDVEHEFVLAQRMYPNSGWFIRFRQEGADMALKMRWF